MLQRHEHGVGGAEGDRLYGRIPSRDIRVEHWSIGAGSWLWIGQQVNHLFLESQGDTGCSKDARPPLRNAEEEEARPLPGAVPCDSVWPTRPHRAPGVSGSLRLRIFPEMRVGRTVGQKWRLVGGRDDASLTCLRK